MAISTSDIQQINSWLSSARFQETERPYTAEDVLKLKGTLNEVRKLGLCKARVR